MPPRGTIEPEEESVASEPIATLWIINSPDCSVGHRTDDDAWREDDSDSIRQLFK